RGADRPRLRIRRPRVAPFKEGVNEPAGRAYSAKAFWTAPVLWRFRWRSCYAKSARGLAQSKTWRCFQGRFHSRSLALVPDALVLDCYRHAAQCPDGSNRAKKLRGSYPGALSRHSRDRESQSAVVPRRAGSEPDQPKPYWPAL